MVEIDSTFIDDGITDDCGVNSIELSKNNFDCGNIGENIINVKVTDNNENFSIVQVSVFVEDTIRPVVSSALTNTTGYLDINCDFVIPDYRGLFTVSDNCGSYTISQSPMGTTISGDDFVQNILFTISDAHGNVVSRNINLTLQDTINPVITASPTDTTGYVDNNCEFTIPDYRGLFTVSDNCDAPTISQNPSSGATLSGHGTFQNIQFTIDDGNGNIVTRNILLTLSDTINPVITASPTDTTGYVDNNCEFTIPDYRGLFTVSDNCDAPTISQNPSSGTTMSGHGTFQNIQFTIDDGNGNVVTRNILLTLSDTINPVITASPTDTTGYVDNNCEFTIPDYRGLFTVSDICDAPTISQNPSSGATLSGHGTSQNIQFTIDDGNGNVVTRNILLTLSDTINPVITASPTDTTGYVDNNCEFTIPDYRGLFTVTDNCDAPTISQNPSSGTTLSGHGTSQNIQFTIDDGNGNVVFRTILLRLKDTIVPVAVCKNINLFLDETLG